MLNGVLVEGFTKFIIGEKDIDYYNDLVEQWKNVCVKQATKEVNETYGANNW